MDRKLWAILWFFKRWVFFFLLLMAFHAEAQSNINYCNLSFLGEHPVKECIQQFEKKLALVNQNDRKNYETEFNRLEEENNIMNSMSYGSLFKYYPHPKVLFGQMKLGIEIIKLMPTKKIQVDCAGCLYIAEHELDLTKYQIIIGMLENKKQLNIDEKMMLYRSKKNAQCLSSILDDLYNNPDKIITNEYLIEQCYSY